MLVQLNYAFQDLNSNVDTEDYTENRAELTINFESAATVEDQRLTRKKTARETPCE
ncbi:MAG: hypothetical protein R2875_11665 [Desulfobacterales bacterium]